MKLATPQQQLLAALYEAAGQQHSQTFCYKSEWLGYLPFGQYQWLEMSGTDITVPSPDTLQEDLQVLEKAGLITLKQRDEIDQETLHTTYLLSGKKP